MENVPSPIRVASLGLIFLSTLVGCRKDVEPAQWDVDVLAPILTTRFTLSDIVPDSLQRIGQDGAITLVYSEVLFAVDLDTVLAIPDTSLVYPYAFPLPANDSFDLPAGFPVISENNLIRFEFDDLALRKLVLREGTLQLNMRNKIASQVFGTFGLTGVTFTDGASTLQASVAPGSVNNPASSTTIKDLANANFDLRGPQFNDVNTIGSNVSAQLDPNGTGATVTNQDSVIVKVAYQGLVPEYAAGYFGTRTIVVGPETNSTDLFSNIVDGTIDLNDVLLRLNIENGIGMDLRVRLHQLRSMNTRTGNVVDLQHAILNGPINLNRALDLGSTFQPSQYQTILDNNNSNVDLFLENLPDQLELALDLEMNPLGDISNGHDFFYYDSRLRASLELEVPLELIASNLTLENIVRPDLPGSTEGHAIRDGELHMFTTNGFPFDAELVLDIIDPDNNVLSDVPVSGTVLSGILGGDGLVQATTTSRSDAVLTAEQVDLLYGTGRIRIRMIFNTADQTQHLRILESYATDLQITAKVNYLVNGDK